MEFPEDWLDFKCEARTAFEECKRDLEHNLEQNVTLMEKKNYLEKVCKWIEEEEKKSVRNIEL